MAAVQSKQSKPIHIYSLFISSFFADKEVRACLCLAVWYKQQDRDANKTSIVSVVLSTIREHIIQRWDTTDHQPSGRSDKRMTQLVFCRPFPLK